MEEDLIRGAQIGDQAAFRTLVEQYTPIVWRVTLVFVADPGQAEDVMQEAWIDVWRGLPQFDITRPFRPWLLTVVANRCRMLGRRRGARLLPLTEAIADELFDPNDDFEISGHESNAALHAALARLLPEQRRLLALRYSVELDLAEIAALSEMPLSTVKSRLYRTLASLRVLLRASALPSEKTETLQ